MKRRIFLLYPYYWPHYKAGGPVQSLYNLVGTLKDDAEFYTVSKSADVDGSSPKSPLQLNQWVKGNFNENIFYAPAITPWVVLRLLKEANPDAVMVNGVFNASTTLPGLLFAKSLGIKTVFSPRGMLQEWGLRRGRLKKWMFLKLLKLFLRKNEEWHATDEQEKSDILKLFGKHQVVHIAPNIPRQVSQLTSLSFSRQSEKIKLVFLSLINPNKNLHLVIDAVKHNEKFELDIYGPVANESYWKICQQQMAGAQAIRYRGAVPPWNITGVLKNYHFFVLPTQGENFGHAIFDALASSVPVIISRNTPWKSIDVAGAGFYIDIKDATDLESILNRVSQLSDTEYQNFRVGANIYAKQFWNSKDYLTDYQFLLGS